MEEPPSPALAERSSSGVATLAIEEEGLFSVEQDGPTLSASIASVHDFQEEAATISISTPTSSEEGPTVRSISISHSHSQPSPSGSLEGRLSSMNLDPGALEKQEKHVFVLSSAGKPIYSRYGDEQSLAPYMGVIQAIISFSQSTSYGSRDSEDLIRSIRAGKKRYIHLIHTYTYILFHYSTYTNLGGLYAELSHQYLYCIVCLWY